MKFAVFFKIFLQNTGSRGKQMKHDWQNKHEGPRDE